MNMNSVATTTTPIGQLANPAVVVPDIPTAGAAPSLCDAGLYVPELLALGRRRDEPRRPAPA